jgi:two-component system, response regulator PdtaR
MSNRAATVSQEEAPSSVLVVEDDFLVRAIAVAHLKDSGFSTVEAQTADEAMVILRDDRSIAAVFSDVQMPGSMDGIALAQWLAHACPNVMVLLTSGRMDPDMSAGWRFIAKPYSLEGNGARVAQYPRLSSGKLKMRVFGRPDSGRRC